MNEEGEIKLKTMRQCIGETDSPTDDGIFFLDVLEDGVESLIVVEISRTMAAALTLQYAYSCTYHTNSDDILATAKQLAKPGTSLPILMSLKAS